ncbi:ABC1 kinase family protein [Alkalicoccus daliensis]|uniref:Predicted unusual protein kinase regulating ubiquinone biosynthesis, AarF/ABC1/UbiB family n=1 Tax=Alkalicoccus daliensis TaxID=745820 RepID=A0A1H0IBX8_9BACI|nr:AarF/UbiB family protein [Alkalicoccus daliensis]SDO28865.1 Predicted unusual protein kinase regulating ubiquinone biosynthesis, AarF/ABC1/UbiB family [Alkalicoccus daliensis]
MKNNAFYRIAVIVYMFLKFVLQLYWFNKRNPAWDTHTQQAWENLVQKQAREYRIKALHLEGLMIKVGQFLSTRADIMPEVFLKELADLIDQVPSIDPAISKGILENEWGQPLDYYLAEISDKPIASASIGEVYKGKLNNGQEVAIKIQRSKIDRIIKTDFKALRIVLWITKTFTKFGKEIDTASLYKEIVQVIGDELDYDKEMRNAQNFQRRFSGSDAYYIPQMYEEYCTRRVLVMEWMEGRKVTDLSYMEEHGIDRQQTAANIFQFFVDQLLDQGRFHADPHQGNILIRQDGKIVILDFGMVGYITREDSASIRRMIQGFVLDDYQLVIDELQQLGFLLPHANKSKLESVLRNYVNMYLSSDLSQLDQEVVEDIFEDLQNIVREQPIQLPSEFAFLGRAASIGLGVLTIVDPDIDFIELGKPVVMEWLEDAEEGKGSIQARVLKDSLKPLLSIPRNLNEWLEAPNYARREAQRIQFRQFDHQRFLWGYAGFILLLAVSVPFVFAAVWMEHFILLYTSASVSGFSILGGAFVLFRHKRWVSSFKENS